MIRGMWRRARIVVLGGIVLTAAGCSATIGTGAKTEPGPVGIGSSVDELKGTPCACAEIPMQIPGAMIES